MNISQDHIESAYWLAQRYAEADVSINIPNENMHTIYDRYVHMDNHCVLCTSTHHEATQSSCPCCIHNLPNIIKKYPIQELECCNNNYWTMRNSKTVEELVNRMHERARILFKLLDQYHRLTDPKPKRKYTRRKNESP